MRVFLFLCVLFARADLPQLGAPPQLQVFTSRPVSFASPPPADQYTPMTLKDAADVMMAPLDYDPLSFPGSSPEPKPSNEPPPLSSPGCWLHTGVLIFSKMWIYGGVRSWTLDLYNDVWVYDYEQEVFKQLQSNFVPRLPPSLVAPDTLRSYAILAALANGGGGTGGTLPPENNDNFDPPEVPTPPPMRLPPDLPSKTPVPLRSDVEPVENPLSPPQRVHPPIGIYQLNPIRPSMDVELDDYDSDSTTTTTAGTGNPNPLLNLGPGQSPIAPGPGQTPQSAAAAAAAALAPTTAATHATATAAAAAAHPTTAAATATAAAHPAAAAAATTTASAAAHTTVATTPTVAHPAAAAATTTATAAHATVTTPTTAHATVTTPTTVTHPVTTTPTTPTTTATTPAAAAHPTTTTTTTTTTSAATRPVTTPAGGAAGVTRTTAATATASAGHATPTTTAAVHTPTTPTTPTTARPTTTATASTHPTTTTTATGAAAASRVASGSTAKTTTTPTTTTTTTASAARPPTTGTAAAGGSGGTRTSLIQEQAQAETTDKLTLLSQLTSAVFALLSQKGLLSAAAGGPLTQLTDQTVFELLQQYAAAHSSDAAASGLSQQMTQLNEVDRSAVLTAVRKLAEYKAANNNNNNKSGVNKPTTDVAAPGVINSAHNANSLLEFMPLLQPYNPNSHTRRLLSRIVPRVGRGGMALLETEESVRHRMSSDDEVIAEALAEASAVLRKEKQEQADKEAAEQQHEKVERALAQERQRREQIEAKRQRELSIRRQRWKAQQAKAIELQREQEQFAIAQEQANEIQMLLQQQQQQQQQQQADQRKSNTDPQQQQEGQTTPASASASPASPASPTSALIENKEEANEQAQAGVAVAVGTGAATSPPAVDSPPYTPIDTPPDTHTTTTQQPTYDAPPQTSAVALSQQQLSKLLPASIANHEQTTFAPADLWSYDVDIMEWKNVVSTNSIVPPSRWLHSAVVVANKMVVFGGVGYNNQVLGDVWVFDPAAESWLELDTTLDSPILPREGHSAVVVSPTGNAAGTTVVMLVFGGVSYGYEPFNDVWSLDLEAKKWEMLRGPSPLNAAIGDTDATPVPRWLHTATVHTDQQTGTQTMYVFGGMAKDYVPLNDLKAWDVATKRWWTPKPLTAARDTPPFPRALHTAAIIGNKLFVTGGAANNIPFDDMWIFNIATRVWSEEFQTSSYPYARQGASLVVITPPNAQSVIDPPADTRPAFQTPPPAPIPAVRVDAGMSLLPDANAAASASTTASAGGSSSASGGRVIPRPIPLHSVRPNPRVRKDYTRDRWMILFGGGRDHDARSGADGRAAPHLLTDAEKAWRIHRKNQLRRQRAKDKQRLISIRQALLNTPAQAAATTTAGAGAGAGAGAASSVAHTTTAAAAAAATTHTAATPTTTTTPAAAAHATTPAATATASAAHATTPATAAATTTASHAATTPATPVTTARATATATAAARFRQVSDILYQDQSQSQPEVDQSPQPSLDQQPQEQQPQQEQPQDQPQEQSQDQQPQEQQPQEQPPQDQPQQDQPPQDQPSQDQPSQEQPPQDQPPQDQSQAPDQPT